MTGHIHRHDLAKMISEMKNKQSDQFFVVFEMPAVGMRMVAKTGHKDCAGIVYILADASPKGIVPVVGQWLLSQFV
jgi:hypothetical protein